MNPTIEGLLLGVAGNALTAVLASLGQGAHRRLARPPPDKNKPTTHIQLTLNNISETTKWSPPPPLESICLFLQSPESESIFRQIYALKILHNTIHANIGDIQTEFTMSLGRFTETNPILFNQQANALFTQILHTIEQSLNQAIEEGHLVAHEVKSGLRHQALLDELSTIPKKVHALLKSRDLDPIRFNEFEARYREQVADRHKDITPPHLDNAKRIAISQLYVEPDFFVDTTAERNPIPLTSTALKLSTHRAVILGNPGAGKSTFAQKLCFDLATNYKERQMAGRRLTPVLVVLRDYGLEKKTTRKSILQFIETTSSATYQVPPPEGAFEHLFLSGQLTVIFDGLDELLDTSYRQEITKDIESFCNLYPSTPIIVTSRAVGYEQAPLDHRFSTYRLAPFNETQISNYAIKWFQIVPELSLEQRRQRSTSFIRESRVVPDLRANPLMLALMCNIYRGENYIPRNRPELYEKCALMLFERWDKSRGIIFPLPFEAHIPAAMKHLAFWIYSNDKHQSGVTEQQLIKQTTTYLHRRVFEDKAEAEKAACEFVTFCKGRAWVFTDTGTTKEGQALYQFTHRTFLEYFTASHLTRTNPTAQTLLKELTPRIQASEWDVVAQLAFHLLSKNVDNAADLLIASLAKQRDSKNASKVTSTWNSLSFAARCLGFIIPSPKITRSFTNTILSRYFKIKNTAHPHPINTTALEHAADAISELLHSSPENQRTIAAEIEQFLTPRLTSGPINERVFALEFGINTSDFQYRKMEAYQVSRLESAVWRDLSDRITQANVELYSTAIRGHKVIALDAYFRERLSLVELIAHHGLKIVFEYTKCNIDPSTNHGGIYMVILRAATMTPLAALATTPDMHLRELSALGSKLWADPWDVKLSRQKVLPPYLTVHSTLDANLHQGGDTYTLNNPNTIYALFCLSAIAVEITRPHDMDRVLRALDSGLTKPLSPILNARRASSQLNLYAHITNSLPTAQQLRVQEWASGKFSFVERETTKTGDDLN